MSDWRMILLGIIVTQTAFEDSSGAQFFQALVDEQRNFVVVFVRLVAQTEDLEH